MKMNAIIKPAREKAPVFFYDIVTPFKTDASYVSSGAYAPTGDNAGDTPIFSFDFEGTFVRVYGYT